MAYLDSLRVHAETTVKEAIDTQDSTDGAYWFGRAIGLIVAIELLGTNEARELARDLTKKLELDTSQPGMYSAH